MGFIINKFRKISAVAVASYMALNAAALPIWAENNATLTIFETVEANQKDKITNLGITGMTAIITSRSESEDKYVSQDIATGNLIENEEISLANATVDKDNNWVYSSVINFNTTNIERAGIYTYTITEQVGSYAGLDDENPGESVNLDVYVAKNTNGQGFHVSGFVAFDSEGNKIGDTDTQGTGSKDINFSTGYTTYDVTFTNDINGNMSNPDKEFTISTAINKPENIKFGPTKFATTNTTDGIKLGDVATATKEFQHEETIVYHGVPENYEWSVSQRGYTSDGYKTAINDGQYAEYAANQNAQGSGVVNADTTVTVKNQSVLSDVTPTGIFNKTAPFALMLAGAGAFAALFFRKKREEA